LQDLALIARSIGFEIDAEWGAAKARKRCGSLPKIAFYNPWEFEEFE
jgi:hypothetical protein